MDPDTLATGVEGVFSGGDAVTGPNTVVEAIAAGKVVAESIDQYLRGEAVERVWNPTRPVERVPVSLGAEEIPEKDRRREQILPVADRAKNFAEVMLGLEAGDAIKEAKRCMRCDL